MKAREEGICALCGEPIFFNEEIFMYADEWCHARCIDEERELASFDDES